MQLYQSVSPGSNCQILLQFNTENHQEFRNYIRKARSRKGVIGIVVDHLLLAGDLNMPKID